MQLIRRIFSALKLYFCNRPNHPQHIDLAASTSSLRPQPGGISMKRLILAAGAGLLALAMAGPSSAADLPRPAYKAPAYVAAPFSWSGFYVGINGGYGWGTSSWSNGAVFGNFDTKGYLAGGTLGYNLQTGVWVWGLEADLDYSTLKGTDCGVISC